MADISGNHNWRYLNQQEKNDIAYQLSQRQGGKCALCGEPLGFGTRGAIASPEYRPVLDHDHDTGRIRGVLHSKCNTDLGVIENRNYDWLSNAKDYLSNWGKYVKFPL